MVSNFIRMVQELKADHIDEKVKNYVLKEYLHSKEWNLESIKKSSSVAWALAGWAESQLSYADILNKVDPMRKEIVSLEEEGNKLEAEANELAETISELEKKTKLLEQQYETLIKEKQEIVTDMAKVEDKVSRSRNLLNNLSSENWGEGIGAFMADGVEMNNNYVYNSYSANLYFDNIEFLGPENRGLAFKINFLGYSESLPRKFSP